MSGLGNNILESQGQDMEMVCMYIHMYMDRWMDGWIHFRGSTHFLELLLQTQQSAFNFNHPLLQHILQEQQNRKTKNSGSSTRRLNAMAKFPKTKG